MNPQDLLARHYRTNSKARRLLESHGRQVADKALRIAGRLPHFAPDLAFIEEAALLHDIGIIFTDAPALGCNGSHPYVCHGVLGRALLEQAGLVPPAPVFGRHIGVRLPTEDLRRQRLPLPERDMRPLSIEEKIIGYADKFYSKNGAGAGKEKTIAEVLESLAPFGLDKMRRFKEWVTIFEDHD